jgi:spore coat polysaccharide biosynthesis protein SpsF (cytidylyltransferase family)
MGSSRLHGKVLAEIGGTTMLERVIARASSARRIQRVVVATSRSEEDDRIEELCRSRGVAVFRGSEHDVLERYLGAAEEIDADPVVRLTADCPLLDPAVVDAVVARFERGDVDYAANINPPTFPDGLDAEVLSRAALERAAREARLSSEREHVTLYIRNHPEIFRLANVVHSPDLSALRWTVDEPEDLELVRAVYSAFGGRAFGMDDVLRLLSERPELGLSNARFSRDEGLRRSLRSDGVVR